MSELSHKEAFRLIHLSQLTAEDRIALHEHLSQCESCRMHAIFDAVLGRHLVMSPESQRPTTAEKAIYMARVKRQNRSQKIMKPIYAFAGVAAIIILVIAGWFVMRPNIETTSIASADSLIEAVEADDAAQVQRLLEAGASPNAVDSAGDPILKAAISHGNTEIVSLLVTGGADVNTPDKLGYALLPRAARAGSLEIVRLLLEAGADVDGRISDSSGQDDTGLAKASIHNHVEVVELLIAHGADVNHAESNMGYTPLIGASYYKNPEIVQILLENGADPNLQCCPNFGGVALHGAAEQGSIAAAQALLDGGADVDITDELGITPLISAVRRGSMINYTEMITILMDADADPNKQDINGNSALHHAAQLGKVDAVPILIAYGASLDLKNNNGETAVDVAKNDEIVDMLREASAD